MRDSRWSSVLFACWFLAGLCWSTFQTSTIVAANQSQLIAAPLIRRKRKEKQGRRLGSQLEEPPSYQSQGSHDVDLWCGSPSQQRRVIVDTGSIYTAFICTGCQSCGSHTDPAFNPSQSSSFDKVPCSQCSTPLALCTQANGCETFSCTSSSGCGFSTSYADGDSWQAYAASDTCFVGDATTSLAPSLAFDFSFGCQTETTGFFTSESEDGIMGMGNADVSFWSQMYAAGKIQNPAFSVCYPPSLALATSASVGVAGYLVLGGSDSSLHTTTTVYTSNAVSASDTFFHVTIRQVYMVGGSNTTSSSTIYNLDLSSSELNQQAGTIVDTGTTYVVFPSTWESAFGQAFYDLTGVEYSGNLGATIDEFDLLPTILLQLEGDSINSQLQGTSSSSTVSTGLAGSIDSSHPYDVIVAIPPSHYMQYAVTERSGVEVYAPALQFERNPGVIVLGELVIMEHDVLFDQGNNRLGWAASECDYSQLTLQTTPSNPVPPPTKKPTPPPTLRPTLKPTPLPTKKSTPVPTKPSAPITPPTPKPPTTVINYPPGACFSESNTVQVEGKRSVAMKDVRIGDKVKDANGNMVKVYSFGHYHPNNTVEYLQIFAQGLGKPLEVSKNHLVFVNGTTVPASSLSPGDMIDLVTNEKKTRAQVKQINVVVRNGVYAPFTTSGTIVVSGVAASSYVTHQMNSSVLILGQFQTPLSMHWFSHVSVTPRRLLCSLLGMKYCRKTETYDADGICSWAQEPYQLIRWLFQQHGLVVAAFLTPTLVLGLMLYGLEVGWLYLLIAALGAVCVWKRNRKVSKHC